MGKTNGLIKRMALLTIVTAMSVSTFAGCSGKAEPKKAETKTTEAKTAQPKEKPKLKFLRPYHTVDMNAAPEGKTIKEITGYEVTYDYLPQQNPLDKLNLLMASGDMEYDYVHLQYMVNDASKSVFASYAKRNQLVQLDDKLKKYPNLAGIDPMAWEVVKVDGKIYGVPATAVNVLGQASMFRKDWLDTLGIQVPQTKDELLKVLREFKAKDPGKLGDRNVPFITAPAAISPAISTMFGFLYAYEPENGKLVDVRLTSKYKDYLTFMNQLYTEKLLDQDYPILKDAPDVQKKVVGGTVGFYAGWVDHVKDFQVAMNKENNTKAKYVVAPPFKSPDGKLRSNSGAGMQDFSFIPVSSKNSDAVLDYLNTFLETKNFEQIAIGKEGEDWQTKDGKRFPILPRFNDLKGNMFLFLPAVDGKKYFPLWQTRVRKQVEYYEVFDSILEKYEPNLVTNVIAFAPAMSGSVQTAKVLDDFINQEYLKFIAGARPLSEFDKFVQEAKTKGADKVLEEYNAWYTSSSVKK